MGEDTYQADDIKIHFKQEPMSKSKSLDEIGDSLGLQAIPDCFFGENYVKIETPFYNLEFLPKDSLKYLKLSDLEKFDDQFNKVPFQFKNDVKVLSKHLWDKKKEQNKEIKEQQLDQDWTYLNHYQGSLDLKTDKYKVEIDTTEIPKSRLGQDNKILHFKNLFLYEDDLGDFGYSRLRLRIRAQKDSIFVLMRSYIRVDQVVVRSVENRYFIDFSENYSITRQFDCLESSWKEISDKGFKFDTYFNLDVDQADKVVPFLNQKFSRVQKITFQNK